MRRIVSALLLAVGFSLVIKSVIRLIANRRLEKFQDKKKGEEQE